MLDLPHCGVFDILVCQIPTIAPYKPEGGVVGLYIDRCIIPILIVMGPTCGNCGGDTINASTKATLLTLSHALYLGHAKLIIRFPFPPSYLFASTTKFSLYGSLHHMDFQIFAKFSLLY